MSRTSVVHGIEESGVVAVIRMKEADKLRFVIDALLEGGVRALELTMTVPGAVGLIEQLARNLPGEFYLGAGTVLDPETARVCMLAGAQFFVTPSLKVSTIEMAKRYSKVICPGALTPTEVVTAWEAGADVVKIFPAGNVGGPKYIKALRGPFPHIEMIPTGGVNLETAGEFLKAGACAVAVAWAVSKD